MNTSMIKIEGLTFKYGKRASVFQDFSLEMEAGKVIGLLGKNGTGKSTLLYLLSGLLRPQAGHLYFRGVDVQKRLPQSLADMYLVPEEFTLPNLSLNQFVRLNASFYPRFSREILRNCLEDFGLNEDIPSKSQFRKVLASGMSEEKSVVISTHQVRDIDRLLDHVIVIDGSQVLLDESVVRITDKLFFAEQGMSDPTDDALYVQPSVHGNSVILPNRYGEESPLNLELLFNALLTESEKIQKIFTE